MLLGCCRGIRVILHLCTLYALLHHVQAVTVGDAGDAFQDPETTYIESAEIESQYLKAEKEIREILAAKMQLEGEKVTEEEMRKLLEMHRKAFMAGQRKWEKAPNFRDLRKEYQKGGGKLGRLPHSAAEMIVRAILRSKMQKEGESLSSDDFEELIAIYDYAYQEGQKHWRQKGRSGKSLSDYLEGKDFQIVDQNEEHVAESIFAKRSDLDARKKERMLTVYRSAFKTGQEELREKFYHDRISERQSVASNSSGNVA